VVQAATDLRLSTLGLPNPDDQPDPGQLHRRARIAPSDGPAGTALDVQHGGLSPRGAGGSGRRHALRRCAAQQDIRATRYARLGVLGRGRLSSGHRLRTYSGRAADLGLIRRAMEPPSRVR
jgi:hypothetical protein